LRRDFAVKNEKVHVVRHGIELAAFPESSPEKCRAARKELGVGNGPLIGMVARLSDVKGQDILLKAMPRIIQAVAGVELLLFGEGKMKPQLERIIADLKLAGHVRFFPVVDDTHASLSVLDICIVPSRQEGLGLAVMEAQACAVAVIAARVGGIVSLIEDGVNGVLVEPNDSEALAKAVIALLHDTSKRRRIAESARRHALKEYACETMIDATIKVYEHACARKSQ
jgi:glycosyltransferase involved in cell wall biosynthesis